MTTPPLPPLPLIDNTLFFDNSFLVTLGQCKRQGEYSLLYKRRLSSDNAALNFGSAWHAAMQARYLHADYNYVSGDLTMAMKDAGRKRFAEHPQPDGEYRTYEHLCRMVDAYNTKYTSENFEILETEEKGRIVEQAFAVGLHFVINGIKFVYTGRIDLGIRDNNMLFTADHKTTFMYGNSFWNGQKMTGQHVGYCWALDKVLNIQTRGYVVNAACTRNVSESRPLPDAKDFQRQIFYIDQERKDEWLFNVQNLIEDFLHSYSKGYLPMNTEWCQFKYGACQFYDVCSLPLSQRVLMLQSGLYEDDTWSPLEQNTQQT